MSEKFNGSTWRKIKDGILLFLCYIPFALLALAFIAIIIIVGAVIKGAILSVCWNLAMPAMFGFEEITLFQALILAFTIGFLRTDFFGGSKSNYADFKERIFKRSEREKLSKILSVIFTGMINLILILITIGLTMYSWNTILPQLLKIELVQINFWQALGFAFMFNFLFGTSKQDEKKSKKKKEDKQENIIEAEFGESSN